MKSACYLSSWPALLLALGLSCQTPALAQSYQFSSQAEKSQTVAMLDRKIREAQASVNKNGNLGNARASLAELKRLRAQAASTPVRPGSRNPSTGGNGSLRDFNNAMNDARNQAARDSAAIQQAGNATLPGLSNAASDLAKGMTRGNGSTQPKSSSPSSSGSRPPNNRPSNHRPDYAVTVDGVIESTIQAFPLIQDDLLLNMNRGGEPSAYLANAEAIHALGMLSAPPPVVAIPAPEWPSSVSAPPAPPALANEPSGSGSFDGLVSDAARVMANNLQSAAEASLMDFLLDAASGEAKSLEERLEKGFDDFKEKLKESLPAVVRDSLMDAAAKENPKAGIPATWLDGLSKGLKSTLTLDLQGYYNNAVETAGKLVELPGINKALKESMSPAQSTPPKK